MSLIQQKARFRDEVDKLLRKFDEANRLPTFVGADTKPALEHITREHFISPFLQLLGWNLSQLNDAMIEEARIKGETTLRLDYLGVNRDTRTPLLIVEAKPWNAPIISPANPDASLTSVQRDSPVKLICAGIGHIKAKKSRETAPVSVAWVDYLAKLQQYVARLAAQSGHVVNRVATLSGRWLVIFDDPKAVFLTGGPVNDGLISVYQEGEFVSKSDLIFDKLAKAAVSVDVPDFIEPTMLLSYTRPNHIRKAFRALWVAYDKKGPTYRAQPTLEIDPAVVVERTDDVLLTVVDKSLGGESLPHDAAKLRAHIFSVKELAEKLRRAIERELGTRLKFANATLFGGFNPYSPSQHSWTRASARPSLTKVLPAPGELLLVTGTATHFLLPTPNVRPCRWHDWASCQSTSHEQGSAPVVRPSVGPRTFFITKQEQHCAHRVVHNRRTSRCHIDAFEEYLCCRTCTLQAHCWTPAELGALPCGKSVAQEAKPKKLQASGRKRANPRCPRDR